MPDGTEHRSESGTLDGRPGEIPLELHGEQVGTLSVAPRPGRGAGGLGEADLRVLTTLAGPLASAAYALRLSGDLEASRRALLDAREEERRRLRRDLHDGLGPQLAGVVMGVDAVRSTLQRGDHARAADLAETIAGQARTAVDDVRRLVSGLRPPVLDDLGLLGALRSSGPAAVEGGPRVTITADGCLSDLPAAVEVAAYRISQEALTNAVRHADATAVEVLLRADPAAVTVRVSDDGRGFSARARRGVGVASMRERAEELGGWCTVSGGADGRGTTVFAHLPRSRG
jgi:signal transduction histidine kinase